MSKEAHDQLQVALQKIRNAEALRLGWRVIDASDGIPFEDDEDFFYLQGKGLPNYPVPANIGYVSLGQDYRNVVYIDDADAEDPVMVYCYDGEQL